MYSRLYEFLKKIYEWHDVTDEEINSIRFDGGLLLKTIKWLFIEWDIRYWNYSGRGMTWGIALEVE